MQKSRSWVLKGRTARIRSKPPTLKVRDIGQPFYQFTAVVFESLSENA